MEANGLPPNNDPNLVLQQSRQLLAESSALTERMFDKGQAYNSAIILAGFGGLFALLAATSSILPRNALAASAILLGISLFTYIGYVIYTMFMMGWSMSATAKKQLETLKSLQENSGVDTADMIKALAKLQSQMKAWTFVWIVSVASGLGAGVLMLVFYFGTLVQAK